jgi:cytochrome b6-f complex subunit 4
MVHDGDVLVKPAIGDPILRGKLAKGMGHNSYGEIAWPNDLLYMFPVCILGVLGLSTSLAYLAPTEVGEISDPFSTPRHLKYYPSGLSITPTFEILPVRFPNKVVGIT